MKGRAVVSCESEVASTDEPTLPYLLSGTCFRFPAKKRLHHSPHDYNLRSREGRAATSYKCCATFQECARLFFSLCVAVVSPGTGRKLLKKLDKWTGGVSGREYFTSLIQTHPWINGDRAHGVSGRKEDSPVPPPRVGKDVFLSACVVSWCRDTSCFCGAPLDFYFSSSVCS